MEKMRHLIKRLVLATIRGGAALFGTKRRNRVRRIVAEALDLSQESILDISLRTGTLKFAYVNELTRWRVETLMSKEPETINWLDTIAKDEVLWDIGANIGLYALYAAQARGARVQAFEPAAGNYYLLNRQIMINSLDDRIQAYCIAIGDENRVGTLQMRMPEIGGSMSSFDAPVDSDGNMFEPIFAQGSTSFTVDELISRYGMPPPNHMKIDVDGLEDLVISGAKRTLTEPGLKSLAIELPVDRPEWTGQIIDTITEAGLTLKWKRHAEIFDEGEHANLYNHLFVRDET